MASNEVWTPVLIKKLKFLSPTYITFRKFSGFPNFCTVENISTYPELVKVSTCPFLVVSKFQQPVITPTVTGTAQIFKLQLRCWIFDCW